MESRLKILFLLLLFIIVQGLLVHLSIHWKGSRVAGGFVVDSTCNNTNGLIHFSKGFYFGLTFF